MGNWIWWVVGAAAVGGAGYWYYTTQVAPSAAPAVPATPTIAPPALQPSAAQVGAQQISNAINELQQNPVVTPGIPATTAVLAEPTTPPYTLPAGSIPAGVSKRMARKPDQDLFWRWDLKDA
jgi:hypothetical protein